MLVSQFATYEKVLKNTHIKLKIQPFMFKQACRQILFALENQSYTFYCATLLAWSLIKREITAQHWIKLAVTRIFF